MNVFNSCFRFKTLQKSPGFKKTFDEKQKFREEMKKIKELSRSLIKERDDAKAVKKERRRENLKRQQENARKAEIVQVVRLVFYHFSEAKFDQKISIIYLYTM